MRTIVPILAAVSLAALAGCAPVAQTIPQRSLPLNVVASGRTKCKWKIVANDRQVRKGGILNGIVAMNAMNAWAVGARGPGLSLVEHWNGSKWKLSPSVNPSSSLNVLFKVAGSSPSDMWAVGEYAGSKGVMQPLVEHWNGSTWRLTKSPLVGGSYGGTFSNVVSLSKNDAWAVGSVDTGTNGRQTLAEHWNGKNWSVVRTPNITSNDNYLSGLAAFRANDVWAGGGYNNGKAGSSLGFTMHWDGKNWSTVRIDPLKTLYDPVQSFAALEGTGTLFLVGTYDNNKAKRYSEFAERLGKGGWSQLNPISPNYYYYSPDATFVSGSAAAATSEVFGVGYYTQGSATRTFAMVWDGHHWTVSLTPNVTGYNSFLNAASAIPGTKNVWTVGGFSLGSTAGPLIEHGECM